MTYRFAGEGKLGKLPVGSSVIHLAYPDVHPCNAWQISLALGRKNTINQGNLAEPDRKVTQIGRAILSITKIQYVSHSFFALVELCAQIRIGHGGIFCYPLSIFPHR